MPKQFKPLAAKLCAIMARVESVALRGHNDLNDYDYATERDIKLAFRSELARRKIFLAPKVLESRRVAVELSLRGGSVSSWVTELRVEWTFHDGETLETITCVVDGAGEDQGDKGVYKALTGSLKALLRTTFMIPGSDDPDADSKSSYKEVREKKVEAAQQVAKEKLNGTFVAETPLNLWYTVPPEGKGLEVAIHGSDEALARYKEELLFRGRFMSKKKCYSVPVSKLDDLKFVLAQLHVELKEVGGDANGQG